MEDDRNVIIQYHEDDGNYTRKQGSTVSDGHVKSQLTPSGNFGDFGGAWPERAKAINSKMHTKSKYAVMLVILKHLLWPLQVIITVLISWWISRIRVWIRCKQEILFDLETRLRRRKNSKY